jgi:serine/threonine protein kinase
MADLGAGPTNAMLPVPGGDDPGARTPADGGRDVSAPSLSSLSPLSGTTGGKPVAHRALSGETLDALHAAGFDLEEAVAAGGFGVVYRARDRRLGRPVAVKVVDLALVQRVGAPSAAQEIRTLATLRHPHIVPLYEAGAVGDDLLYLVMPWLEGASLRRRLRSLGRLPLGEVLRLGIDLADALAELHAQGLVHRDVKPENVLLDGDHAMVIDFGLVCASRPAGDAARPDERLMGTPAYMSPEQWTRGGPVDARTDVYSLGCLLYELLAGHAPHDPPAASASRGERDHHRWTDSQRSTDAVTAAARGTPRDAPSIRRVRQDVPVALDRLLQQAMDPVLERRLASAALFRQGLQRVQAELLNGHQGRRTRRTVILAAVAVVLLVPWLVGERMDRLAQQRGVALDPQRVLVTPVVAPSGDRLLDTLAAAVSTRVSAVLAARLERSAASASDLTVLAAPTVATPSADEDPTAIALPLAVERGAGTVVAVRVARGGDGLEMRGVVIDALQKTPRLTLPPAAVPLPTTDADLQRVADSLAEAVAGAVASRRGASLAPGGGSGTREQR